MCRFRPLNTSWRRLAGCGVHNALIEIDGPEVPIMDGIVDRLRARYHVQGCTSSGQPSVLALIEVLKPVTCYTRRRQRINCCLRTGLIIDFHIDFEDGAIGNPDQNAGHAPTALSHASLVIAAHSAAAQTLKRCAKSGLALGGTLENAVVVQRPDEVLTPGGFRHADEAVRHKMLDALGDLYTGRRPILGSLHRATNRGSRDDQHACCASCLLKHLARCVRFCVPPNRPARLPGQGVGLWDEIPEVA